MLEKWAQSVKCLLILSHCSIFQEGLAAAMARAIVLEGRGYLAAV
jgi:hypothetical protein